MDIAVTGRSRSQRIYYDTTTMCPTCDALLPGQVVAREGGVFVTRCCPAHGVADGLVCSDVAWYDSLPRFDVPPARPPAQPAGELLGCPRDCGLCAAHCQIAGTAAIEISNRCNSKCPVCLADNRASFELGVEDVRAAVDELLRAQGKVDAVALSGGEPTLHPQLFDILRVLDRPEIGHVLVNTNGITAARDDRLLDGLARFPRVRVGLHYDGKFAARLRGTPAEVQERALERLGRWGIAASPVVLAAQGVNDGELGDIVMSLLRRSPPVPSMLLSMMTYTGSGGSTFPCDPRARLTIPGALDAIERGSGGAIKKRDFIPLPMPNPICAAIGYFLVDGGEITPLIPLADLDRVIECTKNANFARVGPEIEELLHETVAKIYADRDAYPDGARLLAQLRALLDELFPADGSCDAARQEAILAGRIRTVYLMQFMDAWTFDTRRLKKCSCQHLLPAGRVVPSCAYYAYHRKLDPRFAAPAST